jgi:MAF protein
MPSTLPPIVLASSSNYRRELLARLQLPFTSCSPEIDETALKHESPQALVQRLALNKAQALAEQCPQHIIIGSDQVAVLDGRIIGKPLHAQGATQQLSAASGRSVVFLTGLAVIDTRTGSAQVDLVPFTVHFRTLSPAQIQRYIAIEQPFDCAGSFKSEGLGVSLFQSTEGSDATSLVGLPLIRLCDMLNACGIAVP